MSASASWMFDWIEGAPFYAETHREAIDLVPEGHGRSWLDVGCGPGLVARLAAERGYEALGVDRDPAMIQAARRHETTARFEVADLSALPDADVVSAASLLIVVPDASATIDVLWRHVRPGGALLIVETTPRMTPENARALVRERPPCVTRPCGCGPASAAAAMSRPP